MRRKRIFMKNRPNIENQSNQLPTNLPKYVYPDDEISLIELWLIITKHKKIFFYVFGAVLILSVAAAFMSQKQYTLSSTLDIGRTIEDDKTVLLESPETVKAKLDNALIPNILSQYKDEAIRLARIEVQIPQSSGLVLIKTQIAEKDVEKFSGLLAKMTDAIVQDHKRILKPIRSNITAAINQKELQLKKENDSRFFEPIIKKKESELTAANVTLNKLQNNTIQGYKRQSLEIELQNELNRLASLKENESILKKKKERLSRMNDLLVKQINELKDQIKTSAELQQDSMLKAKSGVQGMATLMINNELQQNRTRLAQLEERLYIDLENHHSELNKEINDNTREQVHQIALIDEKEKSLEKFKVENQLDVEKQSSIIIKLESEKMQIPAEKEQRIAILEQEISNLNDQLSNLIDTRVITQPIRSQLPTNTSRRLTVMLGGVVGIIFGFIAILIAVFMEKVHSFPEREGHAS